MINKLLTIFILCSFSSLLTAQQHRCGVTHEDQLQMIDFIEAFNKKSAVESSTRSVDPIFIPVRFHLTANNDGTGRIKAKFALSQMAVLIDAYKELDMFLYLDETGFNYINSTSIYNNPGNFMSSIVNNKDSNALNIFVTENANPPGSDPDDPGEVLGYYSTDGDYIIIRNNDVANGTSSLTHEVGHFFALPHTFFGWEGVYSFYNWVNTNGSIKQWQVGQFNGQYTANNAAGSNILAEVMNESNCLVAADRICDTPPDYNFGFGAPSCQWTQVLRDKNNDVIDPQENNIMSYFGNCSEYVFTEGQQDVMFANFNGNSRSYIRRSYIPDTTEITSNHEIIEPTQNEKLEYYNKIFLDWTDAEGASNYLVSITASGNEVYEFITQDSEIEIEELTPNKFYFWEVQPFNDGYTKTTPKSSFFTTGTELNTAVKESQIIQDVNVFPNPGQIGQDITARITMDRDVEVSISLIDITGKIIQSQNRRVNQGSNTILLNTVNERGIYILKLDTEDGSIHKKIVIQ